MQRREFEPTVVNLLREDTRGIFSSLVVLLEKTYSFRIKSYPLKPDVTHSNTRSMFIALFADARAQARLTRSLSDWPPKLRIISAIDSGFLDVRIRKHRFQRSVG